MTASPDLIQLKAKILYSGIEIVQKSLCNNRIWEVRESRLGPLRPGPRGEADRVGQQESINIPGRRLSREGGA